MEKIEQLLQEQIFFDTILNYEIRAIDSETRFWMIRTKKGYFYNEFISNNFIALAWNTITSATDFSEESQDVLKDQILLNYSEIKRPTTVINKCNSFIHDVKPGDYIVIPNAGSERITIALAGEYYEEESKTYEIEKEVISRIEVRTINGGNAPKNLDYERYEVAPDDIGLRLIAVGGLSLSRGLTLEGLCTSYFYRNSSMYDTLMQMGRWFGYRGNYQDMCKIWMPEVSMAWYSYISAATDELRAEVRRMQNENMTPADFGLAVRSDIQGLMVTARNKMRSAKDYETVINFSGEVVETKYVHSAVDVLRHNYEETEAFLQNLQMNYPTHQNDPTLAVKHPQMLNVKKDTIIDYLRGFSAHTMNAGTGFVIHELVDMFAEDESGVFDEWDVLIAGGSTVNPQISFAGMSIHPVNRSFTYRKDTKSLQMSGKNSRLGSKDLAKGGLTKDEVAKMVAGHESEKSFSESFYFKTGYKRRPLLVVYPVKLDYTRKAGEDDEQAKTKEAIAKAIDFPVVGLSVGVPLINGKERVRIKYKINKQKWLEIFGADDPDDFDEVDETIPED